MSNIDSSCQFLRPITLQSMRPRRALRGAFPAIQGLIDIMKPKSWELHEFPGIRLVPNPLHAALDCPVTAIINRGDPA